MSTPLFLHLCQPLHTLGDFKNIHLYLEQLLNVKDRPPGIHLFATPELFLCGYGLQDVYTQPLFQQAYQQHLKQVEALFLQRSPRLNDTDEKGEKGEVQEVYFLGGALYTSEGLFNVVYEGKPGQPLRVLYRKKLLPNYDVFDEKRYFTKGPTNASSLYQVGDYQLGLLICEDMWFDPHYHSLEQDPVLQLHREQQQVKRPLDLVINFSASPFTLDKVQQRLQRAQDIVTLLGAPFAYVNKVGGEGEILFDGRSFILDKKGEVLKILPSFEQACEFYCWQDEKQVQDQVQKPVDFMLPWEEQAVAAILFGLKEYLLKNQFESVLVAVSGGLDSALVAALAKLCQLQLQRTASGKLKVELLYMPGPFSSELSTTLAQELAKGLELPLLRAPIKFLHQHLLRETQTWWGEELLPLTQENLQARLRGMLLATKANQGHTLILNTSNKSELAVGYSTLYGDSIGGLSLLGDLFKTQVISLAKWINGRYGNLIPTGIIERPATAELKADQTDEATLLPYPQLDALLAALLQGQAVPSTLGISPEQVQRIARLYHRAEYKRYQACPILKLHSKSFGLGRRMPLCSIMDDELLWKEQPHEQKQPQRPS